MNLEKIIEQNYDSIVKRGLINKETSIDDFFDKLNEEINEMQNSHNNNEFSFELADVILVCLAIAKHYDIDIEYFLKEKIKINYERANENIIDN